MRLIWCIWLFLASTFGAEVIPPKPARFVNDYANVLPAETERNLNGLLENLEKSDGTQIIVAIFPKMESDGALEAYTVKVAQAWGVGRAKEDNGAVLFIFMRERAIRIEVGYGLEGVLPDITAKQIIDQEITPRFRAGDFAGGVTAGVNAMIQAVRGEYRGSGRTLNQVRQLERQRAVAIVGLVSFFIVLAIIGSMRSRRRGVLYRGTGRRAVGGPFWSGGWGSDGGGWSGGSSGGFTGGGGGFGGGGASGRW